MGNGLDYRAVLGERATQGFMLLRARAVSVWRTLIRYLISTPTRQIRWIRVFSLR